MTTSRYRQILKRLRQQGYVHHHWPVIIHDRASALRAAARLREGGCTVRIVKAPPTATAPTGGYVIMRKGGKS